VSGLPGGVVTFLFTDIEGSTGLVKALRERYPRVLAEHRRLVRAAVAAVDGHEVDTQGDAFFVGFADAKQAVLCALAIQQALAGHAWPANGRVRVRIGIHTRHSVPAGGMYTGLAVHRAARICASARGGQVLVSQATQSIIEDEEERDPGFTLVDLGERKLKDLDRPVRLFQLVAPGLDTPPGLDAPAGPAAGPRLESGVLQQDRSFELPSPAAARGRAPVADVPAAMRREAASGDAMRPEAEGTPAGVVPRQLSAEVGFFAGREGELKELDALLDRAGSGDGTDSGGGGAVVISAVAGMAGVGKTALAVHWARKVAGRFPDGQVYVNLRGFDTEGAAVTAKEVTGWFLVALGVPAAQIPADAQARYGLYRSVLAGRRVLVVLDNARDAAQVRPLLPGSPGCLVVVTSRSSLTGLAAAESARPLRLGPLGAAEGVRLLAARLGPERVAAEPGAVTELVARCGYLPLALAVMAARAAADPGLPLGVLAGQLTGAAGVEAGAAGQPPGGEGPGRLEVLETGDPATSLSQLLSWSHRQLSSSAAGMFALLGVHCGPDITIPAAASLAGVPAADTRRAITELTDASLLTEHRLGRYVMHDLVRGYAAEHARQALGTAGIREAIGRSLDHYLHTMLTLSYVLPTPVTVPPPSQGVVPEHLTGETELDWVQAEHQVLLQATAQAADAGFITRAWQLWAHQGWFLGDQGYWADFRAAGQAVLAAAHAAGDQAALGWIHVLTGWYSAFTGPHDEDLDHLNQALDHFRQAGDLPGQAWAYLFTVRPAGRKGDWPRAAGLAEQALALFRRTGHRYGERTTLVVLGECHTHLGNYDLARGYARHGLELAAEPDDRANSALAWNVLGLVHTRLGEQHEAITCHRQALDLARDWKTPLARMWLASLLASFGDACQAIGDLPTARQAWQQALQIRHDLGFRRAAGSAPGSGRQTRIPGRLLEFGEGAPEDLFFLDATRGVDRVREPDLERVATVADDSRLVEVVQVRHQLIPHSPSPGHRHGDLEIAANPQQQDGAAVVELELDGHLDQLIDQLGTESAPHVSPSCLKAIWPVSTSACRSGW
jgi:class 3 adenylate cyclase/tetratricopeptide (TPR) repeat protein